MEAGKQLDVVRTDIEVQVLINASWYHQPAQHLQTQEFAIIHDSAIRVLGWLSKFSLAERLTGSLAIHFLS